MNTPRPISSRLQRLAALLIAGMAILILVALHHHPVVGHSAEAQDRYVQMAQLRTMDNLVHGALMAMLVVLATALAVLNTVLEARQPVLRWALAAYCLGCALLGLAMLFDGFVVPRLAEGLAAAQPIDAAAGAPVMLAIGAAIQVFSKAGLIAHGTAMLAWSCATAASRQVLPGLRWFPAIGVTAALPSTALLLFADLRLTPHSLMAIFVTHALWYLAVAWLLYRGAAPQPSSVMRTS